MTIQRCSGNGLALFPTLSSPGESLALSMNAPQVSEACRLGNRIDRLQSPININRSCSFPQEKSTATSSSTLTSGVAEAGRGEGSNRVPGATRTWPGGLWPR